MSAFNLESLLTTHRGMTLAWLVLVTATCIAWSLSGTGDAASLAMYGVLISAFIKTWVIGFQFMELRHAPNWLRHGFDAWNIIMCSVLIVVLQ